MISTSYPARKDQVRQTARASASPRLVAPPICSPRAGALATLLSSDPQDGVAVALARLTAIRVVSLAAPSAFSTPGARGPPGRGRAALGAVGRTRPVATRRVGGEALRCGAGPRRRGREG